MPAAQPSLLAGRASRALPNARDEFRVSVKLALEPDQLEQAQRAGYRHVEIFLREEDVARYKDHLSAALKRDQALFQQYGLTPVSVAARFLRLAPDDSPQAYAEKGMRVLAVAEALGASFLTLDFPAPLEKSTLRVPTLPLAARALTRLAQLKKKKGSRVEILLEHSGGSDISFKHVGFRNFKSLSALVDGSVLDAEHFAQERIVQPVENVNNPVREFLETGDLTPERRDRIRFFYDDYKRFMKPADRARFKTFLAKPSSETGERLLALVSPTVQRQLEIPGAKQALEGVAEPSDIHVTTNPWANELMIRAWSTLPIKRFDLTGGAPGTLIRRPVATPFGLSDDLLEHSFVIHTPREKLVLGSVPEYEHPDLKRFGRARLYYYLHRFPGSRENTLMPEGHLPLLSRFLQANPRARVVNVEVPLSAPPRLDVKKPTLEQLQALRYAEQELAAHEKLREELEAFGREWPAKPKNRR